MVAGIAVDMVAGTVAGKVAGTVAGIAAGTEVGMAAGNKAVDALPCIVGRGCWGSNSRGLRGIRRYRNGCCFSNPKS